VSSATASRVVNHNFRGDVKTAERVFGAVLKLGYQPNPLARSLAVGSTNTVGFVVPDLANPAFQGILSSLSKEAGRAGYRTLIADTNEDRSIEQDLAQETRRRCDCVVLCAPRMPEEQLVELVNDMMPVVIVNRASPQTVAPSVSVDYAVGVRAVAEHLYRLGHRSMVYLHGPETSASNELREAGLRQFQRAHPNVECARALGGISIEHGAAAAQRVIDSGSSAVVAYNDLVAIGVLHGLRSAGVRVPDDVSVAGFDDIAFARYTRPQLTSAAVPLDALGRETWRRLDSLINHNEPEPNVVFEPKLTVRESTAPALLR
jgi:LacI family transcriptional regulator